MRCRVLIAMLLGVVMVGLASEPGLVPAPVKVMAQTGWFDARKARGAFSSLEVSDFNRAVLDSLLRVRLGAEPELSPDRRKAAVSLLIDTYMAPEAYTLNVAPGRITITGGGNPGVYYGLMTLSQLITSGGGAGNGLVPCVTITDSPRYPLRALMIDPARHFLPADDVKRFIDLISRFKFNALQLHLTDDQGWRMEIKSHPELTAGQPHYSQVELADIVRFAADRNVTVIPEIDIPGHTAAFLHAHPEMMCAINDSLEIKLGETVNLMLCAANDRVYDVYDDIIREVAGVFPSEWIHLGGDESAIAANWDKCVRDKALADSLGLEGAPGLMAHFFDRIFRSVRSCGKKPVMWCELDNIRMPAREYFFDYPQDVTLVTWRNGLTPKCVELTQQSGHNLIMAPGEYAYLDYPQYRNDFPEFNNWGMPMTTLEKVYDFDPSYGGEYPAITGVMGTLWGEAMPDINRVTYMAFPRALALAEAGWTPMERRDWDSFRRRLVPVLTDLMLSGVSFRVPFEIYP